MGLLALSWSAAHVELVGASAVDLPGKQFHQHRWLLQDGGKKGSIMPS